MRGRKKKDPKENFLSQSVHNLKLDRDGHEPIPPSRKRSSVVDSYERAAKASPVDDQNGQHAVPEPQGRQNAEDDRRKSTDPQTHTSTTTRPPLDIAVHALHSLLQFIRLDNMDFKILFLSAPFSDVILPETVKLDVRLPMRTVLAAAIDVLSEGKTANLLNPITGPYETGALFANPVYSMTWEDLVDEALHLVREEEWWTRYKYVAKAFQIGGRTHHVAPPPLTVMRAVKGYLTVWWDAKKATQAQDQDVTMVEAGVEDSSVGSTSKSDDDGDVTTRFGDSQAVADHRQNIVAFAKTPGKWAAKVAAEKAKAEERALVNSTLRKIDRWADLWLKGELEGDEDWKTMKVCYIMD